METTVKSRNLVLTEALKDYAHKKISHLQKYFDHPLSADITLSTERGLHEVDVSLHANGALFRGEEKTDDMYASIDKVVDKLERQILKYKGKLKNHHNLKASVVATELTTEKPEPRVITGQNQTLRILMPEAAVEEMERLGHHFYLFRNRNTEEINLAYRRENGTFGLIKPI